MNLEVKRSPGRVAWWVVLGDAVIAVCGTRREATVLKDSLQNKYGALSA